MGLFKNLPEFRDGVGQIISATDLDLMRQMTVLVDQLTYRREQAFNSTAGVDVGTPGYFHDTTWHYGATERIWKGCLRYRTGMTTLTIVSSGSGTGSPVFRVYVDGVSQGTISATSVQTTSYALSGTDGQIKTIEIRVEGTRSAANTYVIHDVYASPLVYSPAWPGVPTFASTYDAAKLGQLVSAIQWVYNRIAAAPIVGGLVHRYNLGPFAVENRPMWFGTIRRNYTEDVLRIGGAIINWTADAMTCDVYVNGALVSQTNIPQNTTTALDLTISLSAAGVSVGSRAIVSIYGNLTNAGPQPWTFSRWSFRVWSEAASAYPAASIPATPAGYSDQSPAAMNTFLNALSTAVSNAKARVDANTGVFGQVRAYRHWYTNRDEGPGTLEARATASFLARMGQRLIVKSESGSGAEIGFGPLVVEPGDPAAPGSTLDKYKYTRTEAITAADQNQAATVYLDSVKDLTPGMQYSVTGRVVYAEELL